MHSFIVHRVSGTQDTEVKMTDVVCLHRVELKAREEELLRRVFVSVIALSFSYIVDVPNFSVYKKPPTFVTQY